MAAKAAADVHVQMADRAAYLEEQKRFLAAGKERDRVYDAVPFNGYDYAWILKSHLPAAHRKTECVHINPAAAERKRVPGKVFHHEGIIHVMCDGCYDQLLLECQLLALQRLEQPRIASSQPTAGPG